MDEVKREMDSEQELDQGFDLGEAQDEGKQEASVEEKQESPVAEDSFRNEGETAEEAQPSVPMLEKTPENISNEYEELKKLNPEAAKLAMEDSPDGEIIRKRLETYGAEYAQDKAESVLEKRRAIFAQEQEQRAKIEEHNRMFRETVRKRNPEYYAMITDGTRQEEAQRYFSGVFNWIENLPYRDARRLMEIARSGRDANQVCDLIERYEREKGRPDPTGAYAVPGRGAALAGAGIGDKNDMDAGWDLNKDN